MTEIMGTIPVRNSIRRETPYKIPEEGQSEEKIHAQELGLCQGWKISQDGGSNSKGEEKELTKVELSEH